ncbi:MAG: energy-coupling factor transporter transmembrane protein EcfT [Clostridiales bacterium]|jgi:energy-coupling factor transport system permease protein|nr:energy-coupling factor transporter transmembrane protein EcfT [Clostridiales bacterium]
MGRDITFGQYYPTDSFLHKLDPRVKFLLMVAYIVAVFLVQNLFGFVAIILWLLIVVLVSKVPPLKVLKSLKAIIFIVIFTAILNVFFNTSGEILWQWRKIIISTGGIELAIKVVLRIVLLVGGTSMLTFTTTPMELTDGLESLMTPLKWIKVPVHDIAIIMNISLKFIPILTEEVDKITMAQKARGASFDEGGLITRAKALIPILIPLFVSAFRRADELALALDARCYNATPNRTKYKLLKVTWRDIIAALFTAILVVIVVAVNNNFWGLVPPYSLWG